LSIVLFATSCCDGYDTPLAAEAQAARLCAQLGKELERADVTQTGSSCFELTNYVCKPTGGGLLVPGETQENWL
jgi:hypothetical protein